jgi:LacI family transcriptional regulator
LESAQQTGYVIPRDLAMVCFDDHALFRLMPPGITCIRQPIEAIASTAVDFLLQQFADTVPPPDQLQELKKPMLVIRGSV